MRLINQEGRLSMKIELDFDGVLYNLNENVLKLAGDKFGIELDVSKMNTYDYRILPTNIRKYIYTLFNTSNIMANKDFLYDDTVDFLKWIDTIDAEVELRTLVHDKDVQKARFEFLEELFKENNIKNITINVVDDKPMKYCDILVEDNPKAILDKNHGIVIMRKHPYNDFIEESDTIIKAENLLEIKKHIQKSLQR